jgi:beta-lactamase class A
MPIHLDRRRALIVLIAMSPSKLAFAENEAPARIAAIESRIGGRIGLAALDTASGKRVGYRASERFAMCSTFKLLAAAAVLRRVDDGKDKLDRLVPFTAKDLLEYAPVTKEHVKEGAMSLDALCEAAIQWSDNTAGNLLLASFGGPAGLTAYLRSLGDGITRLDRTEPELNTAIQGDERDTTTPDAMLADLRELLTGDALSVKSRNRLEGWLTGNKTGGALIRAGVPADWRVGDKTGRGANHTINDVAILNREGRAPVLLAIYTTQQTASTQAHEAAIAEAARVAVEAL